MNLHLLHKKHKLFAVLALLGLLTVLIGANMTSKGQGKLRFFTQEGEEIVLSTKELEQSPYQKVLIGDLGDLQIKNIHHEWDAQLGAFWVNFDVYNIPQPGAQNSVELSSENFEINFHAISQNGEDTIHFVKNVKSTDTRWIPSGEKIQIKTMINADQKYAELVNKTNYTLKSLDIHVDTENETPEWDEMNNKKTL